MVVKIPKGTIRRIAKDYLKNLRISNSALTRIQDIATDFIRMTLTDAERNAKHGNRKTIQEKDVILATS